MVESGQFFGDPKDGQFLPRNVSDEIRARAAGGIKGLRIGVLRHLFEEDAPIPLVAKAALEAEGIVDDAVQRDRWSGAAQCVGYTQDGLPLSMQIVGRPFDDATVLRVAYAYEAATPWRERRPTLEPSAAVSTALPPVPEPAQPDIDVGRCDEIAAICRRAGLTLNERHSSSFVRQLPMSRRWSGGYGAIQSFMRSPPASCASANPSVRGLLAMTMFVLVRGSYQRGWIWERVAANGTQWGGARDHGDGDIRVA